MSLLVIKPICKGPNCEIAVKTHLDNPKEIKDFTQLSANGYPFIGSKLVLEKSFYLTEKITRVYLDFSFFDGAGAVLIVDDHFTFNYWNQQEKKFYFESLSAGKHSLKVELFPSTFNAYGPFRYIGGDSKVISPLQYSSEKNLMDPPDYPEHIQHNFLNYKNTGIGEIILQKMKN